jgi:hypothetical protein
MRMGLYLWAMTSKTFAPRGTLIRTNVMNQTGNMNAKRGGMNMKTTHSVINTRQVIARINAVIGYDLTARHLKRYEQAGIITRIKSTGYYSGYYLQSDIDKLVNMIKEM